MRQLTLQYVHAWTRLLATVTAKLVRGMGTIVIPIGWLFAPIAGAETTVTVDLTGVWQTQSGAIYAVAQKGEALLATYLQPSQGQSESGISKGDIAYSGNIVGGIATGVFHHRMALDSRGICPATWYFVTPMHLAVSKDGNTMEGDLLVGHQSDDCFIDDRRIDHLKFTRVPAPTTATHALPAPTVTIKGHARRWLGSG
jgi:hypothetical protein